MDHKDGPQTSKMKPKIDENLVWGPYRGRDGSPDSNLGSQGCPGGGSRAKIGLKNIEKQYFLGSSVGSQGGLLSDSLPVGNPQKHTEKPIFYGRQWGHREGCSPTPFPVAIPRDTLKSRFLHGRQQGHRQGCFRIPSQWQCSATHSKHNCLGSSVRSQEGLLSDSLPVVNPQRHSENQIFEGRQ